jgi:hypothetical protein
MTDYRTTRLEWAQKLIPFESDAWLHVHKDVSLMLPYEVPIFDEDNLHKGIVSKSVGYLKFEKVFRNDIFNVWKETLDNEPSNAEKETILTKIDERLHKQVWLPMKRVREAVMNAQFDIANS